MRRRPAAPASRRIRARTSEGTLFSIATHFFVSNWRNRENINDGAKSMALTDRRRLQLYSELFLKAAQLHVQQLKYTAVRRYLKLDSAEQPLRANQSLVSLLRPSATGPIRDALGSISALCSGDVKAHESVRVLFRRVARDLKPRLLLAYRLGAPHKPNDAASQGSALVGMLTVCDFTEEEALCTDGVEAALMRNRKRVDLSNALLIDVVCAKRHSGAGRGLLGELLPRQLKMRRGSKDRRDVICAVAATRAGLHLFDAFGFESIKIPGGDHFCWLSLDDLDPDKIASALIYENTKVIQGLCIREGLTKATRGRRYLNGC